jgi:hypothetical protein
MGFNLNDIQKGPVTKPRKIVIYGPPKTGKSTLVGATKNALMIPTEDRVAHIACDKTPVVKHYSEAMDIFNALLEGKHTYKRIILDSLDWFENLLHQYLCEKKGLKSLTDDHNKETAFSKGLKYVAVEGWKSFLYNCDVMRDNGFDVIIVAHSHTVTVSPPDSESYYKHVMKIDKNALAVVEEWADIIGFYTQEIIVKKEQSLAKKGKAMTTNKRILHISGENPSMINGNSFGLGDVDVTLEHCSEIMEWMLTANNNQQ